MGNTDHKDSADLKAAKQSIGDLPKDMLYAALLLAGLAGYMIWDQFHWWGSLDDYSFGYLLSLIHI